MNKNIVSLKIIGYYDHANLGDEEYKISFKKLFDEYLTPYTTYTIDFIDCDKLQTCQFSDSDIIILGGGDVLTDYFLDKIISKFSSTKNKILAVSVGLPFTSTLLNTHKLNIIDYIFIRTLQDLSLFQQYFYPHRIMYIPDISYLLAPNIVQKSIKIIDSSIKDIYIKLHMLKYCGKK